MQNGENPIFLLLKTSAMFKALLLELQKYGKIEDIQAQVINRLYIYS
jgi:hypothetical protein